jgi:hypothetical protein
VDRHLLPEEIDLLLDSEVGFGTAPLKAHARKCEQCRAELEQAKALVAALEHLPYLSPSPMFAQRVMGRVQVFVPWQVALLDWARGWVPRTRPAMAAASVALAMVATVLTVGLLWVVARFEVVVFALGMGLTRAREILLASVGQVVRDLFGEPVLLALQEGGAATFMLALTAFLLMALAAAGTLRLLAAGVRRR